MKKLLLISTLLFSTLMFLTPSYAEWTRTGWDEMSGDSNCVNLERIRKQFHDIKDNCRKVTFRLQLYKESLAFLTRILICILLPYNKEHESVARESSHTE